MEVCLEESFFGYEDGLPLASPKTGTVGLHRHCLIAQQTVRIDEDYDRQVWELMVALWGKHSDFVEVGKYCVHRRGRSLLFLCCSRRRLNHFVFGCWNCYFLP